MKFKDLKPGDAFAFVSPASLNGAMQGEDACFFKQEGNRYVLCDAPHEYLVSLRRLERRGRHLRHPGIRLRAGTQPLLGPCRRAGRAPAPKHPVGPGSHQTGMEVSDHLLRRYRHHQPRQRLRENPRTATNPLGTRSPLSVSRRRTDPKRTPWCTVESASHRDVREVNTPSLLYRLLLRRALTGSRLLAHSW